ncbi:MAG: imidazoleglycerol-phosphate dehydratase HisB [Candidatus Latescibacteria bacterium]|nr:imidazoleglycerol-phosphate dehydratase HisB [Candidatus Latescibacterota bacterium]
MARTASRERKTKETSVSITLNLDGTGESQIETGIGFFDHMLTLFARHGFFDLTVKCEGDTEVDFHHSVEDVGITLGLAFYDALGDKSGIARYGYAYVPMEYALARAVVDLSGRIALDYNAIPKVEKIGIFDIELVPEFFKAFVDNARMNLHIDLLKSSNGHHDIEAIFKAVTRALASAIGFDSRVKGQHSTKGLL